MWMGDSQLLREHVRLLCRALELTEMGKLMKTVRNRHGLSLKVMERASGGIKWAVQSLLKPKCRGVG